MPEPTWPTVAEAVILTGRSKTVIYDLIEEGKVRAEESSGGMVIELAQLRRVLANRRRPGRPRKQAA